ncbi:MAG: hypothetical protein M1837_006008 [Sclerophora amabilis]|nr:MAG: hypothetical protein M1837_006008 [Sclerophora amabilis]
MWSMNYFFSRFADAADGTLAVVNSRMGIMQRLFNPTRRHFDVLQAMLVGLSLGTAFLFPASITTGLTIAKLPALTKMGYPRQSFGLKSPPPGKPKPGTEGGGGRGPSPGPGPSNAQNGASWKDGKDTKKDELDETKKELPSYTDPIAISLMEGFGGSLAAARAMFPRYTFDSQREQTAKAEENVAILTQELVTGFHETLKVIESDMESFIAFASTGAWSAEIPDAFDMRGSMTMSMMTFMITSMLNSNNIHGVVGLNTDPVELATNGSQLEYPIDCTAYDEYGMCDGWWYSPDLNAAFSLVDMDGLGPGDQNKNTHYRDHLQYLFSNNLTTGENLFLSAWDCMRRQSQVSDWLPSIGASPGCMSTLQLHFWDMSCDTSSTTGPVNTRSCEFTDRKPQIGFGARRGGLEHFLSLPPGYLGPHIYKHRSSAWKISRGNLANNTKGDIEKEDAEGQVM